MGKAFGSHDTSIIHTSIYINELDAADFPNYKFVGIIKTFYTIAYYLCIYPFKFSIDEEGNIKLHEFIVQKVRISIQIALKNV